MKESIVTYPIIQAGRIQHNQLIGELFDVAIDICPTFRSNYLIKLTGSETNPCKELATFRIAVPEEQEVTEDNWFYYLDHFLKYPTRDVLHVLPDSNTHHIKPRKQMQSYCFHLFENGQQKNEYALLITNLEQQKEQRSTHERMTILDPENNQEYFGWLSYTHKDVMVETRLMDTHNRSFHRFSLPKQINGKDLVHLHFNGLPIIHQLFSKKYYTSEYDVNIDPSDELIPINFHNFIYYLLEPQGFVCFPIDDDAKSKMNLSICSFIETMKNPSRKDRATREWISYNHLFNKKPIADQSIKNYFAMFIDFIDSWLSD